ncbi:MAG: hypothetical protein J6T74_05185 [Clostridia bacterium]|nr:hypothetical protein [Clostridia bacterium]
MFEKIIDTVLEFPDWFQDKFNSITNYLDNKLYTFKNRKELAKKAAIKVKVKELADKFGLPVFNEYNLAITNNTNAQWLINLCCTNEAGYYISCPSDYVVSKCGYTNFKYGVVVVDWKHFYELDDSIDKHIQKLLQRYKKCVNEAKIKQIEFDFNEDKEPLYKDLCNHYKLFENMIIGNHYEKHYHSRVIPNLDLYFSPETNKITINSDFVEQDPDPNQFFGGVEIPCNTFEEYKEFIDLRIKNYKEQIDNTLNEILTKKDKNKNDN